jgi:NAD(P)-dependent dehydrogenase (short-subunit alcohol dehydrogenase family)
LITGASSGVGLATALRFADAGHQVCTTSRWPLETDSPLQGKGLHLQADASQAQDTTDLMAQLSEHGWTGVDHFVSNVALAPLVRELSDLTRRGLHQAISYSAFPIVDYTLAIHAHFGSYPRYVTAVSSQGAMSYHPNYEAAACAKAALETLVRYLAHRLGPEGVRVNAVRPRWVNTPSLLATIGQDFPEFVARFPQEGQFVSAEEVGDCILALGSGCFDGMNGQILDVDHGCAFSDTLMRLYQAEQHQRSAT